LDNATLLDQRELLATGVYQFDTYNTQVHKYVGHLSDNGEDPWMDHPETLAQIQTALTSGLEAYDAQDVSEWDFAPLARSLAVPSK
jgi:hypothetical protein